MLKLVGRVGDSNSDSTIAGYYVVDETTGQGKILNKQDTWKLARENKIANVKAVGRTPDKGLSGTNGFELKKLPYYTDTQIKEMRAKSEQNKQISNLMSNLPKGTKQSEIARMILNKTFKGFDHAVTMGEIEQFAADCIIKQYEADPSCLSKFKQSRQLQLAAIISQDNLLKTTNESRQHYEKYGNFFGFLGKAFDKAVDLTATGSDIMCKMMLSAINSTDSDVITIQEIREAISKLNPDDFEGISQKKIDNCNAYIIKKLKEKANSSDGKEHEIEGVSREQALSLLLELRVSQNGITTSMHEDKDNLQRYQHAKDSDTYIGAVVKNIGQAPITFKALNGEKTLQPNMCYVLHKVDFFLLSIAYEVNMRYENAAVEINSQRALEGGNLKECINQFYISEDGSIPRMGIDEISEINDYKTMFKVN